MFFIPKNYKKLSLVCIKIEKVEYFLYINNKLF